jgi:hypothetical protein
LVILRQDWLALLFQDQKWASPVRLAHLRGAWQVRLAVQRFGDVNQFALRQAISKE